MISVFINSLTSGGAEKVVLTLLERFKSYDNPLELILIEKERFYDLPSDIPANYLTSYDSLEKGLLKIPYIFICAIRLKKSIKKPGQIVQSHLLRASFINILAKVLGAKHHAQIVIHSRINFDHKPAYYRAFAKWIYKQVFRRADSIVSICQVMKNELDDYLDLKAHPMHKAIYNPHNLEEIKQKAKAKVDFAFDKNKKYLISVGRIVSGKRIKDLITAFSQVKKGQSAVDLIIIGDGDLRESLEEYTRQLKLKDKIHFLGYQQNPFAYIARADIMVLSSEWEGLPNILIESMACGTAVISADCISGPREIINPESDLNTQLTSQLEYGHYGILYPVGDVDLLAKAIQDLLADDTLRENYIAEGLVRASDFDQAKIAAQYFSTFE